MFESFGYFWHLFYSGNAWIALVMMLGVTTFVDIAFNRNADFLRVS